MKRLRDRLRRKLDWCPQSPLLAWLSEPWIAASAAVLTALVGGLLAAFAPLVALMLVAGAANGWRLGRRARRGQRQGWRVDQDGLWELRWDAPGRLYPWDSIEQLLDTPEMLAVICDGEVVMLPHTRPGSTELARALHDRLDAPGEVGGGIAESQIAEWLGIAVDGRLEMWVPRRQRRLMIAVAIGLIVVLTIASSASGRLAGWWGLLPIVLWPPVLRPLAMATTRGLRVKRQWVDWDEIRDVWQVGQWWHVKTRQRTFYLPAGPEAERVAATIRQLIAARRAGQPLPRMSDIPEAALSRAEGADDSAQRGISVTSGDEP